MANGEERGERRRWLFIWIVTAFAIGSYGVQLWRPDMAPPVWVAPAMVGVVGAVVAGPAASRVLRRNGSDR